MRNTFKILFYLKKNALLRNGNAPIMGRITIRGERTQFATHHSVDPALWDVASGRVAGRTAEAQRINDCLARIRYRIEECYHVQLGRQQSLSSQSVKEAFLGIGRQQPGLIDFFRRHNEEFRLMVGVSRSRSTYYKYRCVCRHLETYVGEQYRRTDLKFGEVDRVFLQGFHAWIARRCSARKNTARIYLIALKHIFQLAREQGYLHGDPFANYKLGSEFVARNYLSIGELNRMIELSLPTSTLQLVRDAFVFCCFTGLSYVDVCSLTWDDIRRDSGRMWISMRRRKTGSEVNVRLFSIPQSILHKYDGRHSRERLFPLPGNGWCNVCLEKIAARSGITRRITFHAARHTFATTVTLSQGMAIETISKLLGHKNIRTTQIYASVTRAKLDSDLERLSRRLDAICTPRISVPADTI